jgi:thiol-disulfide isomerase/thioredoxin
MLFNTSKQSSVNNYPVRYLVLVALMFSAQSLQAQLYERGDIVENFTLTNRETGEPVSLYDLEGKIIFLEWFAWWCPFCEAAANDV